MGEPKLSSKHRPRDKKPQLTEGMPMPWKGLGDYILERSRQHSLSLRKLAAELNIDPSHLSRIVKGKVTPYPETCKRIAEYFGDPVALVLRLAGWIDESDVDVNEFMRQFYVVIKDDADLKLLYEIYMKQETPEKRHAFVRAILAAFGGKQA